ncbi:hypothetical protein CTI12_AA267340 [Artemisia annua]|uniref:KIB1-4 beta-propeller domain-containing protein n=1 Tax=Artemisia annua TaxID=35608 RepID=A0A2U1NGI0_ARTAN|nr:hypothetical protein CTI12_AA267340 [Artemisia annua]
MDWSFMLPELLNVIAHKHIVFYEDYHSFAGVCKSWHTAALQAAKANGRASHLPSLIFSEKIEDEDFPEFHISKEITHTMRLPMAALTSKSNGPPSRLPSLLLSHHNKKDKEFRELFLLSNQSIRKIRLPEAYGKLYLSSCGWLLTVGIRKLVFLAPLSLVVVLWGCSRKLGFCRIGDNKWTTVQEGWSRPILDITYYNGRLYCFDYNHHVRSCDVNGEDPTKTVVVSRMPEDVYNEFLYGAYILGLDDNERKRLLVVIKEGMYDNIEDKSIFETYKAKRFQIFEYDLQTEK